MLKGMDGTIAPELKVYHARKAKAAKDETVRLSGENLPSPSLKRPPGANSYRGRVGPMSQSSPDGNCTVRHEPQPGAPRELLRAIDQLAVRARALDKKHDRIVDGVATLRRRLRDAEDELDQLRHAWLPWQLARKRRLVRHRDSLRARLGNARGERELTERSIAQTGAALVAHYQAVRALLRPLEALPMSCPECGQEASPDRVAPAGDGWREGWYECAAGSCGATWTARWSGGAEPVVKVLVS